MNAQERVLRAMTRDIALARDVAGNHRTRVATPSSCGNRRECAADRKELNMHHIDPLTLNNGPQFAPPGSDGWAAQAPTWPAAPGESIRTGTRVTRMSLSIRSTFRLITTFLQGCQQPASAASQAATINAALELARIDFALVARRAWCTAQFRSACQRCLQELESLVQALSTGIEIPPGELDHALDMLITLLVQLDAASREDASESPGDLEDDSAIAARAVDATRRRGARACRVVSRPA